MIPKFKIHMPITLLPASLLLSLLFLGAAAANDGGLPGVPAAGGITVEEAVFMALENNRALHVQRIEPEIRRTFIEQERGLFDPVLSGEIRAGRERYDRPDVTDSLTDTTVTAETGLTGRLPTGTRLEVEAGTRRLDIEDRGSAHETRIGMSVTQALLQGRGVAVNMAAIRQASLDAQMSGYELIGFAQSLVAEVETVYWEYVLARQQVEIVEQSLELAGQQLEETRQRVRVGELAETEIAAARAEIALRREALINAKSRVDTLNARLTRLISPARPHSGPGSIHPESRPEVPPDPLEALSGHVETAMRLRPDLRQAEMQIQRGDIEIVRTKNGLLPRMDLFVNLGKTGYADSFSDSVRDIDGDAYDAFAGIQMSRPLSNRDADARHRRARLSLQQREMSFENLKDLVAEDVELAYIEVRRTLQQVDATESTRRFQEEKLRAETAKFRVGRSTALLVAQAQRDLLESQVSEVAAITNYLKARINFYLMEGSLLDRRGIGRDI